MEKHLPYITLGIGVASLGLALYNCYMVRIVPNSNFRIKTIDESGGIKPNNAAEQPSEPYQLNTIGSTQVKRQVSFLNYGKEFNHVV